MDYTQNTTVTVVGSPLQAVKIELTLAASLFAGLASEVAQALN